MDAFLWIFFIVVYGGALVYDIWRNRRGHEVQFKEAAMESLFWVAMALIYGVFLFTLKGTQSGVAYISAFLVEKILSIDNLFVFLMIFTMFEVPDMARKRVLLYGVLGAVILRTIMIFLGVAAIEKFHFLEYVFGLLLLYSAYKMFAEIVKPDEHSDVRESAIAKFIRKFLPYKDTYDGARFRVLEHDKKVLTKLALVLCIVEATDLLFAVDSIPAVLALSHDPLIVFTSNIAAVMGLRALYFLFAHSIEKVRYIKHALVAVLGFVGIKMLLPLLHIEVSTTFSLVIVVIIISTALAASSIHKKS